jgi:hypothetical protein
MGLPFPCSKQVGRLLAVSAEVRETALESLVHSGFLTRTSDGAFLRTA